MSSTITLLLFISCCLVLVSDSLQDEITTNNMNMYNTNKKELVEIGNTNNENYNFENANYQPTQFTQVVFGKPKLAKTRKARPPTREELGIKHRILGIWNGAQYETGGQSVYLRHLGRILDALNPKYISTQRVRDVAFADPNNPDLYAVPPESEYSDQIAANTKADQQVAQLASEPLKLVGKVESLPEMIEMLARLEAYFKRFVDWDTEFVQSLKKTDNRQLNTVQLAFKHLIETLSQAHSTPSLLSSITGLIPADVSQYIVQAQAPVYGPAPAPAPAPVVKAASPSATIPKQQPKSDPYYKPAAQQPQVHPQPQLQQQQQQQQSRRPAPVSRIRKNYSPPKIPQSLPQMMEA